MFLVLTILFSVLEIGAIAFASCQLLPDVEQATAGYHCEVLSSCAVHLSIKQNMCKGVRKKM